MVKVSVNGPFQNLVTKVWTFKMSSFSWSQWCLLHSKVKRSNKIMTDVCSWACDKKVSWHTQFHGAMRFQCVDMNDFTMRCDFNVLTCTISRCNAISMCWHERFHNAMRFQCVDMYNFTMQCNFNVLTWTISRCDFDVLACMISQCDLNVLTSKISQCNFNVLTRMI